jgi:hypothetical protein
MAKQFWRDSNFRRDVDENCALLDYYAPNSVNFLPTFRENRSRNVGKKLPLGFLISEDRNDKFSEMSVRNYQYFLRNSQEERSSKIRRVRSLLSRDFEFDNLMSFLLRSFQN